MTNLLVWREYLKRFFARFEDYLVPGMRFLLGLAVFFAINGRFCFMESLDRAPILLLAALLCALLPLGFMVFAAGALLLLHAYALSLECALSLLLVYLFMAVVYFRFSLGQNLYLLLTPLLFCWHIPYVLPLAAGLFGGPAAGVAVFCGVILYYTLHFFTQNASAFAQPASLALETAEEEGSVLGRFQDVAGGLLENREMAVVALSFLVTALLVYFIRRQSIDYSRLIAVLAGTLCNVVILLVGDLRYGTDVSIPGLLFGSLFGAALALTLQFFHFRLDYARTERTQFEDDDYYYYVKAVPKMAMTVPQKKVKKITTDHRPEHNKDVRAHRKGKRK